MPTKKIEIGQNFSIHVDNLVVADSGYGFSFDSETGESTITCSHVDEFASQKVVDRQYTTIGETSEMVNQRKVELPSPGRPVLDLGAGGIIEGDIDDYEGFPEIQQLLVVSNFTPRLDQDYRIENIDELEEQLDSISDTRYITYSSTFIRKMSTNSGKNTHGVNTSAIDWQTGNNSLTAGNECHSLTNSRNLLRFCSWSVDEWINKVFENLDLTDGVPLSSKDRVFRNGGSVVEYKDTFRGYIAIKATLIDSSGGSFQGGVAGCILSNLSLPIVLIY